jgi:hypothetical protein
MPSLEFTLVVPDLQVERPPMADVGDDKFKHLHNLLPAQRNPLDMVLGSYRINEDIEEVCRGGGASLQISCGSSQVNRLPQMKRRPEGGGTQSDSPPPLAHMGDKELERGWGRVIVLVRFEQEG